jgi:hypothetical protein
LTVPSKVLSELSEGFVVRGLAPEESGGKHLALSRFAAVAKMVEISYFSAQTQAAIRPRARLGQSRGAGVVIAPDREETHDESNNRIRSAEGLRVTV